jgi:CRISPR-associated endonuclease/helicase Cas3
MNVLIVNESEDKALVRSRRTLSRYLPQLGSRTWAGLISEEGLRDLEAALRKEASKNTSVACHVVQTRTRLQLRWVVGSNRHFEESGHYAYRTVQAAKRTPDRVSTQSAAERCLTALLRLSALFHDLGKASKAFQNKLSRGGGAEQLRHDLLSMLMVAQSLGRPASDKVWLEELVASPEAACRCADGSKLLQEDDWLALIRRVLAGQGDAVLATREELKLRLRETPMLASLLWLVLTHHRLPGGTNSGEQLDAQHHLNGIPRVSETLDVDETPALVEEEGRKLASLDECLVPAKGVLPWTDPGWRQAVQSAAKSALGALEQLQGAEAALLGASASDWALLNAHLLRPNLIQADHLASLMATDTGRFGEQVKRWPLANLRGKGRAGDSLTTHLTKVSTLSRRFQGLSLAPQRFPHADLPKDSPALATGLPDRFAWQELLSQSCEQSADRPTFVVVVAETGAGKTLGGLRAAYALRGGSLRLTMALSLRSLTWQTAQSTLSDARLAAEDLVVAVGQPHTLTLADQAQRLRLGSDSALGSTDDFALATIEQTGAAEGTATAPRELTSLPSPERLGWLEGLCTIKEAEELWGARTLNLLSTPVLACTADQLVKAVSLLRGGDVKASLRLTTSDLLLDEIDSYAAQDLQSIGKLALLAGLGGRHVIVMSATASPAVVEGLHMAWQRGLQLRKLLTPTLPESRVLFASHLGRPVEASVSEESPFAACWNTYAKSVCAVYADDEACPPRRRARVLALGNAKTREDVFEATYQEARRLHSDNHEIDKVTGKRASLGFLRFNTAKSAWHASRWLAARAADAGIEHRVVAYHAKFPRNYLGVLDAALKNMCTRKSGLDPLQESLVLRQTLDSCDASDLMVLVCTTTLIETGRDFDFDWCVLEPRSTRGEVQAVGRVRRHRPGPWLKENVTILEWPIRKVDGSRVKTWSMPGVEDLLAGHHFTMERGPGGLELQATETNVAPVRKSLFRKAAAMSNPGDSVSLTPVPDSAKALPQGRWAHKMDASVCLQTPSAYSEDRIGSWEQHYQAAHLTQPLNDWRAGAAGRIPSLAWYLGSLAPMTREHATETRFRASAGIQVLFAPPDSRNPEVRYVAPASREWMKAHDAELEGSQQERWLLQHLAEHAQLLASSDDPSLTSVALKVGTEGPELTKLTWSPWAGFLEGHVSPNG